MIAVVWLAAPVAVLGTALVLDTVPWFRRRRSDLRLAPYLRVRHLSPTAATELAASASTPAAVKALFGPSARGAVRRLELVFGRSDELAARLRRAGREPDVAGFRTRQLVQALGATALAVGVVAALGLPLSTAAALVAAAAAGAVLVEEHRLNAAVRARSERLQAELVVVVEQLGLLLSAGRSVPGAIARVAERSNGVAAADLRRVGRQIRAGMSDTAALAEWAERADLDAVRRLVSVLALHREAGDLGALIATEARALRSSAHRDLLESIERRSQLVWVPVTVATLVPGLLFLAVPFMSAMDQVVGR